MNGFDFLEWLKVALPVAGALVPLVIAIVQFLGKVGVSGTAQLISAFVIGLVLGFFAQVAFFGVPASVLGWFLVLIFGIMVAGGAVGTYEAVKSAARKALRG